MRRKRLRARRLSLVAALGLVCLSCGLQQRACGTPGMVRAAVLSESGPRAGDPIPSEGLTIATSPDARMIDAWYERVAVGSYRKVGRRNPKWDRDAVAFIRSSSARLLPGATGPSVADLVARGRTLRAAGCDDPLILYLSAQAEAAADSESRESSELFERAFEGMYETPYPRAIAYRAAEGLYEDFAHRQEGTGKRDALAPVELRWFMESLDDGSYAPDEDVVLLRHIVGEEFYVFFGRNRAAVVSAVERHAWVHPWIRLYLEGKRRIADAWDARGDKFANKVTQQGWKGFEESLKIARAALTASWEARKDRPEAAAAMIIVAMADGRAGESPRLWFDRSVRAWFDYKPAYDALINALRVPWSGDPQALPDFARACAATRRFDTVVPFMAFTAMERSEWDVITQARPKDPEGDVFLPFPTHLLPPSLYRDREIYDMVAAVLERYRREPAQKDSRRYASLQAAIAYKAGRYQDAQRFLHDCDGVLSMEARRAVGDGPLLEGRIEAYAAPDGAATRRAEALFEDGNAGQAVPLFSAALAHANQGARSYLAQRLAAASAEVKLAAGETVQLLPASGLEGWTPLEGTWSIEKDGSLLGVSGSRGLLIVADARVGPDFEIETDAEIASTSNGQFQAGIVFGEAPSFWSRRWSSFRWKNTAHEGEVVYFSKHFMRPEHIVQHKIPLRNRVVIRSWHGRLSAFFNGEAVVTDYAPEWNPPQGLTNQVGFGGYLDDNTFSLRFHSATLRRLTEPPSLPSQGS